MPPHAGEIEQEHYLAADAETAAPPGIAETRNAETALWSPDAILEV
jgi:hypothetical protein